MELEQVQETAAPVVSEYPKYPSWPSSKPGPQVSLPPHGHTRVGARSDQVTAIVQDDDTKEQLTPSAPEVQSALVPGKILRTQRRVRPDMPGR